jgi:hypothetical protein
MWATIHWASFGKSMGNAQRSTINCCRNSSSAESTVCLATSIEPWLDRAIHRARTLQAHPRGSLPSAPRPPPGRTLARASQHSCRLSPSGGNAAVARELNVPVSHTWNHKKVAPVGHPDSGLSFPVAWMRGVDYIWGIR